LTDDYILRQWGVADGVPEAIVMHVTQAPDGFLWITTPTRIAHFDGRHFVTLDAEDLPPQLPTLLRGVHFDPRGDFWIYGDRGVWRHNGTNWRQFAKMAEGGRVLRLLNDPSAAVVCVAQRFLYRVLGDNVEAIQFKGEGVINDAVFNSDGVLTIAADDGVYRLTGNAFEKEQTPLDPDRYSIVQATASGSLLVKGRKGFAIWREGGWHPWEGRNILYPRKIHSDTLLMQSDNEVWLAGSVVGHLKGEDYKELGRQDGFVTSTVHYLYKDRSGSVWLATRGGLYQLLPRTVRLVHNTTGVGSDAFSSVIENANHNILCGVNGGGILQGTTKALYPLELKGFPSYTFASALLTGRDGTLWIGTQGDFLWSREPQTGLLRRNIRSDESISALLEAHDGTIYAGTWSGLRRMESDKASSSRFLGGMPHTAVYALLEDRKGQIWAGYQYEGLVGFSKTGRVVRLGINQGLPDASVRALCEDPKDGLWIGTMKGLVWRREDGSLSVFGVSEGLPEIDIRQILDDGAGGLWLGTAAGIVRIERADAEEVAQKRRKTLRVMEYGTPEGLDSEECPAGYGHGCLRLSDGRLLFCTLRGLAVISPSRAPDAPSAVAARVEQVTAGAELLWARRPSHRFVPPAIELPAGTHVLTIRYTVPEYLAPSRIRFRYWMEGVDETWSESTESRTALYQNVSPGRYTFRLSMRLRNGDWVDQGVQATLIVPALFWQTAWFKALIVLACMVLAGMAVFFAERYRSQRQIVALEHERAIEQERSRIARDLHDDIGAALTRVAILGNLTQSDAGDRESTHAHGKELFNTAQRMTRSLREIVWALNPRSGSTEDCINFMTQYAQQFLGESGLHCRLNIPDTVPEATVDARARHALLMAFKEALNNAVKHAGTTGLNVRFAVEGKLLTVSVEDKGCGMDVVATESARRGHGIDAMWQRMNDCGGRFEITSLPETGTTVLLQVPLVDMKRGK
jgi:signal transduction histidine kinase/ligand-binding sensor domain-containing protein